MEKALPGFFFSPTNDLKSIARIFLAFDHCHSFSQLRHLERILLCPVSPEPVEALARPSAASTAPIRRDSASCSARCVIEAQRGSQSLSGRDSRETVTGNAGNPHQTAPSAPGGPQPVPREPWIRRFGETPPRAAACAGETRSSAPPPRGRSQTALPTDLDPDLHRGLAVIEILGNSPTPRPRHPPPLF